MKKFWIYQMKDIMSDYFNDNDFVEFVVQGIIAPLAVFALMCLAGWMETTLP